jgi:hypothetical protein
LASGKTKDGKRYADFVLILDNLEKISRVQGQDDGYKSHRQFFIESASQLTGLGAHVIYTIPLPLVIHDGPELAALYGRPPFVLPMIKVETRLPARGYDKKGEEILQQMLQKRAGTSRPLDTLIKKDAVKFLLHNCGGHTRQLMTFTRDAIARTKEAPIKLPAAHRAIGATVDLYSRMPGRYWAKLAKLERSDLQTIDADDPDVKAMLQQLIILEYRNGGKQGAPFASSAPWYAVHPIVRQLPQFQQAIKRFDAERKTDDA